MGPYSYTVLIRLKLLLFSFYEAFFRLRSQILERPSRTVAATALRYRLTARIASSLPDNEVNTVRIRVGINDSEYPGCLCC